MKTGFAALVALGAGAVGLSTATPVGSVLGLVLVAVGVAFAVATASRAFAAYTRESRPRE